MFYVAGTQYIIILAKATMLIDDGGLVWKHPYIPMNKSYQEHSFIRLKCWKNLREKYELDLLKCFKPNSRVGIP